MAIRPLTDPPEPVKSPGADPGSGNSFGYARTRPGLTDPPEPAGGGSTGPNPNYRPPRGNPGADPGPVVRPPPITVKPKPVQFQGPPPGTDPPQQALPGGRGRVSGSGGMYKSGATPQRVDRRRGVTKYSHPVHPSSARRRLG